MNIVSLKQEMQNVSDVLNALAVAIDEANNADANGLADALEDLRDEFAEDNAVYFRDALSDASIEDFFALANI